MRRTPAKKLLFPFATQAHFARHPPHYFRTQHWRNRYLELSRPLYNHNTRCCRTRDVFWIRFLRLRKIRLTHSTSALAPFEAFGNTLVLYADDETLRKLCCCLYACKKRNHPATQYLEICSELAFFPRGRASFHFATQAHFPYHLSKDGTSYIHNLLFISNLYIEYKVVL